MTKNKDIKSIAIVDKYHYENLLFKEGYQYIAGVDEVGRGPLAGPVVACAVILPKDYKNEDLYDSKNISEIKSPNSVSSSLLLCSYLFSNSHK